MSREHLLPRRHGYEHCQFDTCGYWGSFCLSNRTRLQGSAPDDQPAKKNARLLRRQLPATQRLRPRKILEFPLFRRRIALVRQRIERRWFSNHRTSRHGEGQFRLGDDQTHGARDESWAAQLGQSTRCRDADERRFHDQQESFLKNGCSHNTPF